MSGNAPAIQILPDFATEIARQFIDWSSAVIRERGTMHVALAGGNTPKAVYEILARPPFQETVNFPAIHFYQGDERPVPPDHPDSNWGMAAATLLDKVHVPETNRHRMMAEWPDLNDAASAYSQMICDRLPLQDGLPVFDLILLGIGGDGHTASLFPGTVALNETHQPVVANPVEQLQTTRLTLTFPVLNRAREVWFLATGSGKASVVHSILINRDQTLPATHVIPTDGRRVWFVDPPAASGISQIQ